jgi:hypothetical protein
LESNRQGKPSEPNDECDLALPLGALVLAALSSPIRSPQTAMQLESSACRDPLLPIMGTQRRQ